MGKKNPLLIVLTPVRNEAWVLKAFLKATSLWADYIIIADQMSDDGSRELYKQFPKVTVIDNPRKDMHQAATRRLLFDAAKKIEGDKILFALDADEFLSGNFPSTKGWKTILNSEPGDVFEFRWMNLNQVGDSYQIFPPQSFYWAAHVNDEVMNGIYPDNFIHEWRLPWPEHENHEYIIDDIYFLHYRNVNKNRERNKQRFYQVCQFIHPSNNRGGVAFHRQYCTRDEGQFYPLPEDVYEFYLSNGVDIWQELNLNDDGPYYTQIVLEKISEIGTKALRKLDIWDPDFIESNKLKDPRRPIDKFMHWYLRKTKDYTNNICVKYMDKILRRLY